jgi:hypothetical protein
VARTLLRVVSTLGLVRTWAFASVGDVDNFIIWMQRAYEERSSYMVYMRHDPGLVKAGVLSDPRFKALMTKAGLGS